MTPGQVIQRQTLPIRKPIPSAKPGVPTTMLGADARGMAPQKEKRKFESLKWVYKKRKEGESCDMLNNSQMIFICARCIMYQSFSAWRVLSVWFNLSVHRDDDDINDVATMGGVNLTEESRNILATNSELMSGQLRSIKDETFLSMQPLMTRINDICEYFYNF